jgi:hypothetical protein
MRQPYQGKMHVVRSDEIACLYLSDHSRSEASFGIGQFWESSPDDSHLCLWQFDVSQGLVALVDRVPTSAIVFALTGSEQHWLEEHEELISRYYEPGKIRAIILWDLTLHQARPDQSFVMDGNNSNVLWFAGPQRQPQLIRAWPSQEVLWAFGENALCAYERTAPNLPAWRGDHSSLDHIEHLDPDQMAFLRRQMRELQRTPQLTPIAPVAQHPPPRTFWGRVFQPFRDAYLDSMAAQGHPVTIKRPTKTKRSRRTRKGGSARAGRKFGRFLGRSTKTLFTGWGKTLRNSSAYGPRKRRR